MRDFLLFFRFFDRRRFLFVFRFLLFLFLIRFGRVDEILPRFPPPLYTRFLLPSETNPVFAAAELTVVVFDGNVTYTVFAACVGLFIVPKPVVQTDPRLREFIYFKSMIT